jgi:hypothetical protein
MFSSADKISFAIPDRAKPDDKPDDKPGGLAEYLGTELRHFMKSGSKKAE